MAEPNTREDFGSYCLRQLGDPVIHIEITPEQVDDRIDDALTMWREYHFDAVSRTYLKHQVTSTDLVNHWIPCSDDIQSVVRVLQCDEGNLNIFDIRYQLRLQDFYNFSNVSMQHYVITLEKLRLIDWLMNANPTISFERLTNRIYLNADWQYRIQLGDYLIFEVYQWLEESEFPRIWHDFWLQRYATALLRKQWGTNVKKYTGVQTLGGITLNGQQIYDEAKEEIKELETELKNDWSAPPRIFIG